MRVRVGSAVKDELCGAASSWEEEAAVVMDDEAEEAVGGASQDKRSSRISPSSVFRTGGRGIERTIYVCIILFGSYVFVNVQPLVKAVQGGDRD